MNSGSEAADQMVREGIQITEAAVKLSALGAKNLAAIALALARDNPKVRGRTRLSRLLRDGKELKVFPIQAGDLAEFNQQAKHYGVLFSAIKDKNIPRSRLVQAGSFSGRKGERPDHLPVFSSSGLMQAVRDAEFQRPLRVLRRLQMPQIAEVYTVPS